MKSLADPLPLRTTAEWPGFREAAALAVRIGRTRGKLTQYNQARTQFVWAGHACQGIDEVETGGLPVQGWVFSNFIDAAGKPVAMVTFDAPQAEGAELTASGRGMMDASGGHLIENPAEAIAAILIDLAGLPLDRQSLAPFAAECTRNAITVGASIETADSGQTVARALAESIGAKFGNSARSLAFLWPGGDAQPTRYTVTDGETTPVALTRVASLGDWCNDLTVQYDFQDGKPRGSIRLVAPAQVARYGSFPSTLAATWVTSAGVAQRVGARLLAHSARKQWLVTASGLKTSKLRIGDPIEFQHALLTTSGQFPVLSRERPDLETCTITARVPIGAAPAVAIASQSAYFDPNAYVSAELDMVGPDRVFTIRDSDGSTPLPNAAVQILPNGPTKTTDTAGRVSFTAAQMPSGHHYELGCTTADGRFFTFAVDV